MKMPYTAEVSNRSSAVQMNNKKLGRNESRTREAAGAAWPRSTSSWRLPSGKPLFEFALQSGFLAPCLLTGSQIETRSAGWPAEPPTACVQARDRSRKLGRRPAC